jgi:hypothetical protein
MIWYFIVGAVLISIGVSLFAGALIKWADESDQLCALILIS